MKHGAHSKVATPTLKLLRSPHAGYLLFFREIAKALLSVTALIEQETSTLLSSSQATDCTVGVILFQLQATEPATSISKCDIRLFTPYISIPNRPQTSNFLHYKVNLFLSRIGSLWSTCSFKDQLLVLQRVIFLTDMAVADVSFITV